MKNISLKLQAYDKQIVPILQGINLQVREGEIISITGPSGSGKTSLMMVISGIEKASEGSLTIANTDITNFSEDELASFRKGNIGVIFQNFHLIPTLTALENVQIALEFAGYENAKDIALESLINVGLKHRLFHFPDQLSGGEQQRTAIARAFAIKPTILLADEPTGNLDNENGNIIIDLLFSLQKKHNTTILLVTHDNNLANKASRKLNMHDGRLYESK